MSTCRNLLFMYYVLAVPWPLTKTLANIIYIYIYGEYPGVVGMLQKHTYIYMAGCRIESSETQCKIAFLPVGTAGLYSLYVTNVIL